MSTGDNQNPRVNYGSINWKLSRSLQEIIQEEQVKADFIERACINPMAGFYEWIWSGRNKQWEHSPKMKKRESIEMSTTYWERLDEQAKKSGSMAPAGCRNAGAPCWRTMIKKIACGELVVEKPKRI